MSSSSKSSRSMSLDPLALLNALLSPAQPNRSLSLLVKRLRNLGLVMAARKSAMLDALCSLGLPLEVGDGGQLGAWWKGLVVELERERDLCRG